MYSICIMDEKEEKPTDKTARAVLKQWQCPICGSRIWLSNKKKHTRSKKHNDANYVLSEKLEIS